eukprot:3071175-Pyramimonas_sp.AAC.1
MSASPCEGQNEPATFAKSMILRRRKRSAAPSEGQNEAETVVKSMVLASQKRRCVFRRPPVGDRILVRGVLF